ncbi:MAG: DUF1080 domain-containing protein [Sedimentisphaerales bacterium]|nr:DUF1080 domain-containing protein [Sedimentisphaerales bacterium]
MTGKSRIGTFVGCIAITAVTTLAALETTRYGVHDMGRPRPLVVTPAEQVGQPPLDATVLFNGEDLSKWQKGNGADANWTIVDDDYMVVPPKAGDIRTREVFGSCQLHVEWRTPEGVPARVTNQDRSNSGVFLMGRYEVQVLDSYTDDNYQTNRTYADGQAASIYGQFPPTVNACRAPGQWQTYDIAFMRPLFDEQGNCVRKARITLFHNGVCVHNNLDIEGATAHKVKAKYSAHSEGPIVLQDHGNPVAYRNIWIRALPEEPYLIE